jgi:hypothetical protein
MKFTLLYVLLFAFVLDIQGFIWHKPQHIFDKDCPDFIWKAYFSHGKYEGIWWGHQGHLHPAYIQWDNTGQSIEHL